MAEEVIRIQESTETAPEPIRVPETMGTVISMESVKPVSAEGLLQQGNEKQEKTEEAVSAAVQQSGSQQPQGAAEADVQQEWKEPQKAAEPVYREPVAAERTEPVYREPAAAERTEELPYGRQPEEKGRDREKKRARDFFHLRKDMEEFTREDWILSRLPEEDLMGYLTMEQKKNEMLQQAKDLKEKRIFTTLQIAISMSAIVAVVALLKDNPTVLVNILYITGIVIALWIWRGKQDK